MTVGEKIQMYRKRLEMSQEDLGRMLLVSKQTISLWEHDQTVPTIDNLIRLREIFGVSVDEILGFEAEEKKELEELPRKTCLKCGFELQDSVNFCGNCGVSILLDSKYSLNWSRVCKISNIILSAIYAIFAWVIGVFGIVLVSGGLPEEMHIKIYCLVSALLFMLTPAICVLAICLSVVFRKKLNYVASFIIQFLPIGTFGIAILAFLMSVFTA